MKESTELTPNPIPFSPSDQEQDLGLAKLLEAFTDNLIEAGPVVRQLEGQASQRYQQHVQWQQRIESATARQSEHLLQISQRLNQIEETLTPALREVPKTAAYYPGLIQRLEALEFNLEQVRLLADANVQKLNQLGDDFIERQVTDHLFQEFLKLQYALERYAANGNPNLKADIQATAQALEEFLIQSGLRIINPHPGAAFDPREHQPIEVVPAGKKGMDGTVAETFAPGLSRIHRVIQPARVAVYRAE